MDQIEEIKLYHRIFIPSGEILNRLLARVSDLNVSRILPRYGLPYGDFRKVLSNLRGMQDLTSPTYPRRKEL